MRKIPVAISSWLVALLTACSGVSTESSGFSGGTISFSRDVLPVFQEHCVSCHGQSGGLSLQSHRELMASRGTDPAVVPGNPDRSDLVDAVESSRMPKLLGFHKSLSTRDTQVIRLWITQGARDN